PRRAADRSCGIEAEDRDSVSPNLVKTSENNPRRLIEVTARRQIYRVTFFDCGEGDVDLDRIRSFSYHDSLHEAEEAAQRFQVEGNEDHRDAIVLGEAVDNPELRSSDTETLESPATEAEFAELLNEIASQPDPYNGMTALQRDWRRNSLRNTLDDEKAKKIIYGLLFCFWSFVVRVYGR